MVKLASTLDRSFIVVKWLTWCDVVVLVVVSRLRCLPNLLRLLLASVSVFVLWLGHLWLLEVREWGLSFL